MILVGVVHNDILGTERLEALLEQLQPRRITVECPEQYHPGVAYVIAKELRSGMKPLVQAVPLTTYKKQFLGELCDSHMFEIVASFDYCTRTGAEIIFIDRTNRKLSTAADAKVVLDEEASHINLIQKVAPSYEKWRELTIAAIDRGYSREPEIRTKRQFENAIMYRGENEKRERHLADRLLALQPDVHIGGVAHVLYTNQLQHMMHELLPADTKKVMLCDAPTLARV